MGGWGWVKVWEWGSVSVSGRLGVEERERERERVWEGMTKGRWLLGLQGGGMWQAIICRANPLRAWLASFRLSATEVASANAKAKKRKALKSINRLTIISAYACKLKL